MRRASARYTGTHRRKCGAGTVAPSYPPCDAHSSTGQASEPPKEDEMAETQVSGMTTYGNGPAGQAPPMREPRREAQGGGWLTFAGVMFLIAATFNTVYGISALANDDYF